MRGRLADRAAANEVDDRQQDDRAEQRIEEALDGDRVVERRAAAEQETGDRRADDADDDVEKDALLSIGAHDHAGQPAANATDDQPDDEYP